MRCFLRVQCLFVLLLLVGCSTLSEQKNLHAVRFFAESDDNGVIAKLPISDISVVINSMPILTENDLDNVTLRDGYGGKVLVFLLSKRSAFDLFALSVQFSNKKILCSYDNDIIGMTIINDTISDGVLIIYPEKTDDELFVLSDNINKAIAAIAKIKKSRY